MPCFPTSSDLLLSYGLGSRISAGITTLIDQVFVLFPVNVERGRLYPAQNQPDNLDMHDPMTHRDIHNNRFQDLKSSNTLFGSLYIVLESFFDTGDI